MTKDKIDQRLKFPFPMRSARTLGLLYMPRGSLGSFKGHASCLPSSAPPAWNLCKGFPVRFWLAGQSTIAASLGEPCKMVKRAGACSGPGFQTANACLCGPRDPRHGASKIMKGQQAVFVPSITVKLKTRPHRQVVLHFVCATSIYSGLDKKAPWRGMVPMLSLSDLQHGLSQPALPVINQLTCLSHLVDISHVHPRTHHGK